MRSRAKQNGAAKDLCRRLTNVVVKWNYVFFPSFEAVLSKLGTIFQKAEFPSSHHREEWWPSDQENIA